MCNIIYSRVVIIYFCKYWLLLLRNGLKKNIYIYVGIACVCVCMSIRLRVAKYICKISILITSNLKKKFDFSALIFPLSL